MTNPKAFQQATADAAYVALRSKIGKPRFLVADEVGLGKTVVAQQVIAKLVRYRRKPLVVYYVSSSLTIASQNGSKLVEAVSAEGGSKSALCAADRLSMLPFAPNPKHPRVHLYTLTPDTSLPDRKGKRRDGRKDERALIAALVEQCWPSLDKEFFEIFPRLAWRRWGAASERAKDTLRKLRGKREIGLTLLRSLFTVKVRAHLGLSDGQHLPPVLLERADQDPLDLISTLRTALVECTFALDGFQPDLVIFDEFQRFRDLVQPEIGLDGQSQSEEISSVLKQLRGDSSKTVPLLLLSATPYALYNQRDEEHLFGSHHDQLFELLCFLFGDGQHGLKQARKAQRLFKCFGKRLRDNGDALDVAAIKRASEDIENHLTPVMSRTERSMALQPSDSISSRESPEPIEVATEHGDWRVFRHLSERFPERYRSSAITYWRSVPLPMQTMGSNYIAWDKANKSRRPSSTRPFVLGADHVKHHKRAHWPHGKLRALVQHVHGDTMCLPWLPPSLPWWSLRGQWHNAKGRQGKILLFGRFRATPKAIAAALSHEARVHAARMGNMPDPSSSLPLTADRMPIFALFYPSLWLVEGSDPLVAAGGSRREVRAAVRSQIKKLLGNRHIALTGGWKTRREFWRLVASLDGLFNPQRPCWGEVQMSQRVAIQTWEQASADPIESVSQGELNLLVDYALGAPGVVLARSLMRHGRGSLSLQNGNKERLIELSLTSWRNYFDNPVFVASLRRRKGQYPEVLRRAVFDGNLEATLDESIWTLAPEGVTDFPAILEELDAAFALRGGRVALHNPDNEKVLIQCQCDVAMPLSQELEAAAEAQSIRPPRADQIRKAFNSPFWPFVLATTSIGQEGLDFHPWCQTVIHWDLPGNPVDLEQREGRIQRYGGLAVRRRMAVDRGNATLESLDRWKSPWRALAESMDSKPLESSTELPGLGPWWYYPGGEVSSIFFHLTASEEVGQLEVLKQQRTIYRLALGQQHQEDFVRMVSTRAPETLQRLAELTPNLSAWKHRNKHRN